jgi:hypothetical protein
MVVPLIVFFCAMAYRGYKELFFDKYSWAIKIPVFIVVGIFLRNWNKKRLKNKHLPNSNAYKI